MNPNVQRAPKRDVAGAQATPRRHPIRARSRAGHRALSSPAEEARLEFDAWAGRLGPPARRNGPYDHHHWCPACDSIDNLHLWVDDEGLGLYCFGCGASFPEVREALDGGTVPPADLGKRRKGQPGKGRVVGRTPWTIRDAEGERVAIHTRLDFDSGSKAFTWDFVGPHRRQHPKAEQIPLYGSEDVARYDRAKVLLVVEGEKCRDRLTQEGYQTVALVAGASVRPSPEVLRILDGFSVILWPDHDAPGQQVMAHVAGVIAGRTTEVAVVAPWPGAQPKDDAVDFLDAHSIEECDALLRSARPWAPTDAIHEPPQPNPSEPERKARRPKRGAAEGHLPAAFWSARPALEHIRQAAWSRMASPDTLLGSVLAVLAAGVDPALRLPPIVGRPVSLALIHVPVAPTGGGKGSAGLARDLTTNYVGLLRELPVGTGEGIAAAYWGRVPDPEDPAKTIPGREFRRAFFTVGEGDKVLAVGARAGSVVFPTLRSAFMGEGIGEFNASPDRRRPVDEGSYSFGLVMPIQPSAAGALLDDAELGLPGRMLFLPALDPAMPQVPPDDPGPLPIPTSRRVHKGGRLLGRGSFLDDDRAEAGASRFVTVDPTIVEEIRERQWRRQTGRLEVAALDAHAFLVREKVAALLGLLDDRESITRADWALAGMVIAVSQAQRDDIVEQVRAERERAERSTTERQTRRALHTDDALLARRDVDMVKDRLAFLVSRDPGGGITRGDARRAVTPLKRKFLDDALDELVADGLVRVAREPGQGTDKVVLYPGDEVEGKSR